MQKKCRVCGRRLSINSFYRDNQNTDGYRSECKDCKNCQTNKRRKSQKKQVVREFKAPEIGFAILTQEEVDMIARTTPAYRAMRKLAMVYKVISYIL
jgi:hypothetical protein